MNPHTGGVPYQPAATWATPICCSHWLSCWPGDSSFCSHHLKLLFHASRNFWQVHLEHFASWISVIRSPCGPAAHCQMHPMTCNSCGTFEPHQNAEESQPSFCSLSSVHLSSGKALPANCCMSSTRWSFSMSPAQTFMQASLSHAVSEPRACRCHAMPHAFSDFLLSGLTLHSDLQCPANLFNISLPAPSDRLAVAGQFPFGIIADRYGGAPVMLMGLAIWSVVSGLTPLVRLVDNPFLWLTVARVALGLAQSCAAPSASAASAQ